MWPTRQLSIISCISVPLSCCSFGLLDNLHLNAHRSLSGLRLLIQELTDGGGGFAIFEIIYIHHSWQFLCTSCKEIERLFAQFMFLNIIWRYDLLQQAMSNFPILIYPVVCYRQTPWYHVYVLWVQNPLFPAQLLQARQSDLSVTSIPQSVNRWRHNEYSWCSHSLLFVQASHTPVVKVRLVFWPWQQVCVRQGEFPEIIRFGSLGE